MEKAKADDDPLWREINFSRVIAELSGLHTSLSCGKPYAVCTACQGLRPAKCSFCRGRGFLSKFRYEEAAPTSAKKGRTK
jgi:hypothetical protein